MSNLANPSFMKKLLFLLLLCLPLLLAGQSYRTGVSRGETYVFITVPQYQYDSLRVHLLDTRFQVPVVYDHVLAGETLHFFPLGRYRILGVQARREGQPWETISPEDLSAPLTPQSPKP
jgi:hypothetical protein